MKHFGVMMVAGSLLTTAIGCGMQSDRLPGRSVATGAQGNIAAHPNLRAASVENIMEAERVLQAKGFDPGRVDGNVDTQFIQALRAFQKKNSLQTTGDLDKATLAVLDAAGARFTGTLRATRNPPGPTDDLSAGEAKPGK